MTKKFSGSAKITMANEGSLISFEDMSPQQVEKYMKEAFSHRVKTQNLSLKQTPAKQEQNMNPEQRAASSGLGAGSKYKPKEEDLIRVPFRAISATVVAAGTWRATDFSDEEVLRKSIVKLVGKSAFTEHFQWADNHIGVVESGGWQDRRRLSTGEEIPAGINVVYLIDAKMNEKLARGLLSDPPSIYSNSVTVAFNWESTHDHFEDENEFLRNLGVVQSDGRMCCRKVTEVLDYHESSILWLGADPFAKILDENGNPVNVDKESVFEQASKYSKEVYQEQKKMYASLSFKKLNINLTADREEKAPKKTQNKMEKKLIELARKVLELGDDVEITQEHIDQLSLIKKEDHSSLTGARDSFKKLTDAGISQDSYSKLKKEKEDAEQAQKDAETKRDEYKKEVEDNKDLVAYGKKELQTKRDEILRLYKLQLGDKADDSVIELIKDAKASSLDGLLEQYATGAKEKFKATCQDCHSENVSFQSSLVSKEGDEGNSREESDKAYREGFKEQL